MKLVRLKNMFTLPSLMVIVGLSVAIMAFQMLITSADLDLTFNESIPNHERIRQIAHRGLWGESTGNPLMRPFAETLCQQNPTIDGYGCISANQDPCYFLKRNDSYHKMEINTAYCSSGLLDLFSFKIIEGDISKFVNLNTMIVDRNTAKKFDLHPGDFFLKNLDNPGETVELVAIYDNFLYNTEFGQIKAFRCLGNKDIDVSTNWNYTYYFRQMEGAPLPPTDSIAQDGYRKMLYASQSDQTDYAQEDKEQQFGGMEMEFVPLDDLHFHSPIYGFHQASFKAASYGFIFFGSVILAMAFFNYVNFFFARIPQQLKSVNTRKVFGCSRPALILSMVLESAVFALVASVLSYVVGLIMTPYLSGISNDPDAATTEIGYKMLILTPIISMAVAMLVSLYPAIYITKIPPALALKGSFAHNGKNRLSRLLTGFQLVVSIVLIVVSIFIYKNNDYLLSYDLGFETDYMLTAQTNPKIAKNPDLVRDRLLQNPDIVDIAWASERFVKESRMSWSRSLIDDTLNTEAVFQVYPVSWNYPELLGIKMTEGRYFVESDSHNSQGTLIFNEMARRTYNLNLDTKLNDFGDCPTIAGFCNDFNFSPLNKDISSFAFYVPKDTTYLLQQLYIRIVQGADVHKTIKFVEKTLNEIDPNYEFLQQDVITFNNEIARNYFMYEAIAKLITMFTVMALLISLMGIFGMVLFECERRRKEIGIRKVNGATTADVLRIFNRRYLILTAISCIFALPLAYVVSSMYLSRFAYHYPMSLAPFALGLLMIIAIIVLTVSAASYKAANENPVKTLKTE